MIDNLMKKLQLRRGQQLLILNPPDGYVAEFEASLPNVTCVKRVEGDVDAVFLFAQQSEALAAFKKTAVAALKADALFWIAYPKRNSGLETDLTRDEGWQSIVDAGWRSVRQVAIDKTWSASRFRMAQPQSDMLEAQYAGSKAHLRPIYDSLVATAQTFGPDVALGIRKSYVSLSRGKQFAIIKASTQTRVDLGLKLKEVTATERLVDAGNFGSGSMTHKVALATLDDVDKTVLAWLKKAYEAVGG